MPARKNKTKRTDAGRRDHPRRQARQPPHRRPAARTSSPRRWNSRYLSATRATPRSTRNWSGRARTTSTAKTSSPTRRPSTSRRRSTRASSSRTCADTADAPRRRAELTLFDTFDGLDELDLVEFYHHQANWSNRMILGDSLNVMASLAEREALRGKVQMIYIDPPYGIKFGSNWQVSARKRDVKDGKLEDASREVEQIKAFRDTWELGIHSYLTYLRDRLTVARDLLTESGSVFVQIGDENVHLVRALWTRYSAAKTSSARSRSRRRAARAASRGGPSARGSRLHSLVRARPRSDQVSAALSSKA